jgi:hypothetical protein
MIVKKKVPVGSACWGRAILAHARPLSLARPLRLHVSSSSSWSYDESFNMIRVLLVTSGQEPPLGSGIGKKFPEDQEGQGTEKVTRRRNASYILSFSYIMVYGIIYKV